MTDRHGAFVFRKQDDPHDAKARPMVYVVNFTRDDVQAFGRGRLTVFHAGDVGEDPRRRAVQCIYRPVALNMQRYRRGFLKLVTDALAADILARTRAGEDFWAVCEDLGLPASPPEGWWKKVGKVEPLHEDAVTLRETENGEDTFWLGIHETTDQIKDEYEPFGGVIKCLDDFRAEYGRLPVSAIELKRTISGQRKPIERAGGYEAEPVRLTLWQRFLAFVRRYP